MKHNRTLQKEYQNVMGWGLMIKFRVKAIMGWRSDAAFYDRVMGRVECTPAEKSAFMQAFGELKLPVPAKLFPDTDKVRTTAE